MKYPSVQLTHGSGVTDLEKQIKQRKKYTQTNTLTKKTTHSPTN